MAVKHPHIIIFMTDQQRWDFTPFSGNPFIEMPALSELSEYGTFFSNAYSPAPMCVPARQSITAGLYPKNCGCRNWGQAIAPDVTTYPMWFGNHGYRTVACGKMHFQGRDQMLGWQQRIGMDHETKPWMYDGFNPDYWAECEQKIPGSDRGSMAELAKASRYGDGLWNKYDRYATDGCEIFLDQYFSGQNYDAFLGDHPLLLQLSLLIPHFPFVAQEKWFKYYLPRVNPFMDEPPDLHPSWGQHPGRFDADLTERDIQRASAAYCGMISEADEYFGRIIQQLKDLNIYDDCIFIFHSDHGEMLGEFGCWGKQVFHDSSVKAPLLISCPGQKWKKQQIDDVVSLTDLYPTLCDLAGLPLPLETDGRSLVPLLFGEMTDRESRDVYSELYYVAVPDEQNRYFSKGRDCRQLMIRSSRYKYIHYEDEEWSDQLFDMHGNLKEAENLIDDDEHVAIRNEFLEKVSLFKSQASRSPNVVGQEQRYTSI